MKICLGIESTAHTFGVGILDFDGNIQSSVNDTFFPEKGGLHPSKVKEHHLNVFTDVINKAFQEAGIKISDVNLVAYSQSPGLGQVLKVGAIISRVLSQKLRCPLVGVNHCIAHVEIGRLLCGTEDPLTLYVSGGNTIVSAFESNRYQIFGETLDIPIGNMLDMIARDLGLPHPGGPKIEKLALSSCKYLELPYIVKGMDLSFSGLYTAAKNLINSEKFNEAYNTSDIAFSLQETAFSMLAEVTERALAHTEKKEVLLTGGVAANKRLQQMIEYISNEHQAEFYTVPLKYSGDNGAMIAWTGILRFTHGDVLKLSESVIKPKERMDQIEIPWRT